MLSNSLTWRGLEYSSVHSHQWVAEGLAEHGKHKRRLDKCYREKGNFFKIQHFWMTCFHLIHPLVVVLSRIYNLFSGNQCCSVIYSATLYSWPTILTFCRHLHVKYFSDFCFLSAIPLKIFCLSSSSFRQLSNVCFILHLGTFVYGLAEKSTRCTFSMNEWIIVP